MPKSANTLLKIDIKNPTAKIVTKTIREVYEALAKNGMALARGSFYSSQLARSACVLGQGAVNLNTVATGTEHTLPKKLNDATLKLSHDSWEIEIGGFYYDIWDILDSYNLVNALNTFRITSDSKWYVDSVAGAAADTIMYWNDKKEKGKYVLRTYEEVVAMAHNVLEPFFDKTIEIVEFA